MDFLVSEARGHDMRSGHEYILFPFSFANKKKAARLLHLTAED
jgi:hypothetical protein